ncbi:AraC family transcriptional regulator [Rhizobium deserti]|uniref:AraC family transcriptional regulator n=1 Tax=Rhizobium deserti TaxID=2547961 RepID=A0A4R5UAT7_9HYPH|nr:AraC family transcriptional regulator [Rhizobium deserti]TDK32149.1 AraC family transcriptional regulator [Rhizobium deserti]
MQALEDTIEVLGQPVFVRRLGAAAEPSAYIARWQHGAAVVDVAPSRTIRLTMSLVDGRNAEDDKGAALADRIRGGSVSIFSPAEGATVEVNGAADVVQLFVDQTYAEAALDAPFTSPPMYGLRDDPIRAAMMRVLVTSIRNGPDDALMVEEELQALALSIERLARSERAGTLRTMFHGGLSPAAFRRVRAMIEAALDHGNSPTLADMARAVDLSITHFVRAFRQQTGTTPHKYIVSRRMDRAVSLLRLKANSVGDVADGVGFSTPAQFVAAFRAAMGVTPGAVRDALS